MADVATVVPPPARRARLNIKPSLHWPLGLLAAAVVFFLYYYLDTYFASSIPASLHDFMHTGCRCCRSTRRWST